MNTWTPVAEALPAVLEYSRRTQSKIMLVRQASGRISSARYVHWDSHEDTYGTGSPFWSSYGATLENVTHWQPLPAPPTS